MLNKGRVIQAIAFSFLGGAVLFSCAHKKSTQESGLGDPYKADNYTEYKGEQAPEAPASQKVKKKKKTKKIAPSADAK